MCARLLSRIRWCAAIVLVACLFLPLVRNAQIEPAYYDNFTVAPHLVSQIRWGIPLDPSSQSERLAFAFAWPLLGLALERLARKRRLLLKLLVAVEILLGAVILLDAVVFTYIAVRVADLHVGALLALAAFATYASASVARLICRARAAHSAAN